MKNKLWPIISLVFNLILIMAVTVVIVEDFVTKEKLVSKTIELQNLKSVNSKLQRKFTEYKELLNSGIPLQISERLNVTVTMYHPVKGQTDDRPNETADGTIIKVPDASSYKYIAVSRNLHTRYGGIYNFGDYVYIYGTGRKDGFYRVKDLMNRRFKNRIDILESPDVKPYKFEVASLIKVEIPGIEVE